MDVTNVATGEAGSVQSVVAPVVEHAAPVERAPVAVVEPAPAPVVEPAPAPVDQRPVAVVEPTPAPVVEHAPVAVVDPPLADEDTDREDDEGRESRPPLGATNEVHCAFFI
jgi:hypothetical protein